MKNILTAIIIAICSISAFSQCGSVGVQVSSSSVTSVQLYHAGFFLIPAGFDNVVDWEVQDFDGTIIHEATTTGQWSEQSFSLFDHMVPITDSMAVMISIVNETSGITCVINDTLAYISPLIEWMPISNNGGVETTVLGIDATFSSSLSCFGGADGAITVEGLNGAPPYSFAIDGGPFGPDPAFTGLMAGEHTIVVTDTEGSMASYSLTLSQPSELILEANAGNIACFGGSDGIIVATASGGTLVDNYDFFIDGAGPFDVGTFSDLAAGSYVISAQDSKGCVATETLEILQPDEIVAVDIDVTNVTCASDMNGSIDFTVTGGAGPYNYTIEGQETTTSLPITDLAAGQYTLTIEDDASCSSTFDFSVSAPDSLSVMIIELTNASCTNVSSGSITVAAEGGSGGYTYTVGNESNETGLFENLFVSDYIVAIVDASGCSIDAPFTIGLDTDFEVTYEVTDVICSGDSSGVISLMAPIGLGYTYFLDGVEMDSSVFINLAAGVYEVSVEESVGCAWIESITITQPAPLFLDSLTTIPVDCNTGELGAAIFTGIGGSGSYTFSLDSMSNASGVFEGLEVGVYSIAVTDSLGCESRISILMSAEGDINAMISTVEDISCNGLEDGMVSIAVDSSSTGYTYELDSIVNETGVFTDLGPGFKSVLVTSPLGCFTEVFVEIKDVDVLELDLVEFIGDDGSGNGSVTVSATGGTEPFQYSIDGGMTFQSEPTFSGLNNEVYTVIVTDANGCEDMISITVTDIKEIEQITNLKVYPNPSAAGSGITVSSDVVIESISLLTVNGQLIQSHHYQSNNVIVPTDLATKGLYILGIKTKEGQLWKKVMITN